MATDVMTKRGLAGVLVLQAGQYTMDVMSTLQSSPWTAENVGADAEKVASLRHYLNNALVVSTAYCAGAAYLAESWWPIIGSVVNNAYLLYIYNSAIKRAQDAAVKGAQPEWGMGDAQVNTGGSNNGF
jgi:hypothetical protein